MMRCTTYFVLFCYALASCHALSLPQVTPLPRKRSFENSTSLANKLVNGTASDSGNSTTNGNRFAMRLDASGGTVSMDVGPLSAFTPTTTSYETPTGTGYIIIPTDINDLEEIPPEGVTVIFGVQTQNDMLTIYKRACDPNNPSDPVCIEGLAQVLDEQAPDLQKRFLPALPVILVVLAADALLTAIFAEFYLNSEPDPKPVGMIHYPSSVLASVAALSTATDASVIIVETATSDKKAITISTTELTSFNPSPTISASSGGTGLLTSDSSGHFIFQIQATDMPALLAEKTAMATPAPTCTVTSTTPLVERDDTDVYDDASCLANELMDNADGLMNPNGLISTFRTQILEVVNGLVPDFVPIWQDLRVAGAFGLFLAAADTLLPLLFPGLSVQGWLVAGFLSFGLAMLPLASNAVGKLQQSSGVTQIVLQVTKGKYGSKPVCPPSEQPYLCSSVLCAGNSNNICTGVWLENCPCISCPSPEDMPSCDDCNSPSSTNAANGKCAMANETAGVNPGCSCYLETMQNSNFEDPTFYQLGLQIWNSLGTWASTTSFPYMVGTMCRPDNSWYGDCQYPNTQTGSAFGANKEFESCLTSFATPGTQQSFSYNQIPNPTMPQDLMMGPFSPNVTMICPTNKVTVDFIINVAYAPGCIPGTKMGQVQILNPIGDGSINGLDVLRGNYYGCLNMMASYDPGTGLVNMVPGSAGQGSNSAQFPVPSGVSYWEGASNSGVGGHNQVGCLIYEVIPSKNRPQISVNNGSSNVWFLQENWNNYVENWPTLAQTYYDNGGWYCKKPPALYAYAPPPCEAFPCPLGPAPATPSGIGNLIQT